MIEVIIISFIVSVLAAGAFIISQLENKIDDYGNYDPTKRTKDAD